MQQPQPRPYYMAPAMRLAATPGVQKVPNKKLDLFILKRFLSPAECRELCALIDSNRTPSTVTHSDGDPEFRTSETCHLDSKVPIVRTVEDRICEVMGIPYAYTESMQGQWYGVGNQFKLHTDYFKHPGSEEWIKNTQRGGQRTWTAMIYLDEPAAGGATRFKHIDKTVHPETGKMLAWCNQDMYGNVNDWTAHAAMPVRSGTKRVLTLWARERPWRI